MFIVVNIWPNVLFLECLLTFAFSVCAIKKSKGAATESSLYSLLERLFFLDS